MYLSTKQNRDQWNTFLVDWKLSEKLHIASAKTILTLLTAKKKNKLGLKVQDCSCLISDGATLITGLSSKENKSTQDLTTLPAEQACTEVQ